MLYIVTISANAFHDMGISEGMAPGVLFRLIRWSNLEDFSNLFPHPKTPVPQSLGIIQMDVCI